MKMPNMGLDSEASAMFDTVRGRAAVLGAFDPARLVDRAVPAQWREPVLRALSEQCAEVELGDAYYWRLEPDQRHAALAHLAEKKALATVAADAREDAVDDFGRYLTDLLVHKTPAYQSLDMSGLDALRAAVHFAGTYVSADKLPDVDLLLQRREAEAAVDFVRSSALIGREAELGQLIAFCAAPAKRRDTFALSGVGGSGKSALLAELAVRLRGADWSGTPVVWLDFDRVALCGGNETAWLLELGRQLALAKAAPSAQLAAFCRDVERLAGDDEPVAQNSYEQQARGHSEAYSLWNYHMARALDRAMPLVLILDTFEEVLIQGRHEVRRVDRWLEALYGECGLRGLRTIVSGRAFPERDDLAYTPENTRELGDLAYGDGVRLLKALVQLDQDAAYHALVGKFGSNPLLLKILAKLIASEGAAAIADLLDPATPVHPGNLFAHGFLYTRVLRRIRTSDADVIKLAHPGLVLRRVTPQLIAEVLAGPCGIADASPERSRVLFDALARQVWLVNRTDNDNVVQHRRDLRKLMLSIMAGDDAQAARAVNQAAAIYYAEERDPYLTPGEQVLECQYHMAMLGWVVSSNPVHAADLLRTMGQDMECVPAAVRAQLRLLVGHELSEEEMATLDDEQRAVYSVQRRKQHRLSGEMPPEADATVPCGAGEADADPSDAESIARAFEQAHFEQVADQAGAAFQRIVHEYETGRGSEQDLTLSPLWQLALSALATGREEELRKTLQPSLTLSGAGLRWRRFFYRQGSNSISLATAMDVVLELLSPGSVNRPASVADELRGPITSFQELRAFQLLARQAGQLKFKVLRIGPHLLQDQAAPYLDHVASAEQGSAGLGPLSRRVGLAVLSKRRSHLTNVSIPLQSALHDRGLMLGLMPELYAPLRLGLQHIRTDVLLDFVAAVEKNLPLTWPAELTRGELKSALRRDTARWISTLVEISDRFGLLPDLIQYCNLNDPWPPLARVGELHAKLMHRLMAN